jgi:hypothetical protein
MLNLLTVLLLIITITVIITYALEKYMEKIKLKIDIANTAEKNNIKNIYDMCDVIYMAIWCISCIFSAIVFIGILMKFIIYIASFVI